MAERIILEFVGDPSGLKPAIDLLKSIGGLTEDQIKLFEKSNEEFAKRTKELDEQTKKTKKLATETKKAEESVEDLTKETKKTTTEIKKAGKGMANVKKEADSLLSGAKKLATAFGLAFGLSQIKDFVKESIRLSAAAEGIERAFRRVGSPALLAGLRTAVRGTVSDLNIMKNAVRADNFQIPLEKLATLFEFAKRRANETGESVDYLVESITTGIGRKSPLILDNLGISAIRLKERFNGVALESQSIADVTKAVSEIAREELAKMGESVDTTSDKIARMSAQWENFKKILGDTTVTVLTDFNSKIGETSKSIESLSERLSGDQSDGAVTAAKAFGFVLENLLKPLERVNGWVSKVTDGIAEMTFIAQQFQFTQGLISDGEFETLQAYNKLTRKGKELMIAINQTREESTDLSLDAVRATKLLTDETQKAYEAERLGRKELEMSVISITSMQVELKDLKEAFEGAEVGGAIFYQIAAKIEAKTLQLKKVLEDLQLALLRGEAGSFAPEPISTIGLGDVTSLSEESSLDGLDKLISAQEEIKSGAQEFSEEYRLAGEEIDRLNGKIDNFGNTVTKVNADVKTSNEDTIGTFSDGWKDAVVIIAGAFNSLFQSISKISNNALQQEQDALDDLLANNAISREKYDFQRKALMRKQAENDKQAALFSSVINTAAAVVEALPNYVLAALVGVLGAAEIAAISSQPIPGFAKGTKAAPEGFAWVGEEGPELRYNRSGDAIITNRDSQILSNDPYGTEGQRIRAMYDLPELHTGFFGPKMKWSDNAKDAASESGRTQFDYDRLGDSMAKAMNGSDRNSARNIDRLRESNMYGLNSIAQQLRHKQNSRSGW